MLEVFFNTNSDLFIRIYPQYFIFYGRDNCTKLQLPYTENNENKTSTTNNELYYAYFLRNHNISVVNVDYCVNILDIKLC